MAKAYLRKDSPYVWITFSYNNKRYREKTKYPASEDNKLLVQSKLPEFMNSEEFKRIVSKDDTKLFDYYINLWLKSKQHLKTTTKRLYQSSYNYWFPLFKGREIVSIKASEIKTILLNNPTKKDNKRNRLKHLKQVFNEAYLDEAIKDNICNKVKLSFNDNEDDLVYPFTSEEVNFMLSSARGYFRVYLAIAFYTGARNGEIFAMKWHNVDFKKKRIYIDATVGNYNENSPKTKSSKRYVPIFDTLMPYLDDYQKNKGLQRYLFQTREGNTLDPSNLIKNRWRPLLSKCNIEYRKLYQTRHTFATTMIMSNKFNPNQIAKILGHSNIQTLMLVYNKFIEDSKAMDIDTNIDVFDTKNDTKKVKGA